MSYKKYKIHQDQLNKNKPLKHVYPNQKLLLKKFTRFIQPYLEEHAFFKRVWVWGSLSRGTFGIYKEPYKDQEGSDIDLLVEVDESYEIPDEFKEIKSWTKTRTYSRAFCSDITLENKVSPSKTINHRVDFICHFPSKNTKDGFYSKVKDSKLIYEK
ncbi:MAG: hypothetical protein CL811_04715 [Colwelliaceae bacterium]|nr:hypothetical protein [Colwelliaceae bacterium]|tara:strand:+ start:5448 stop:5918 length:471 start_codon:yes stop_codon:yes gene_type:complete